MTKYKQKNPRKQTFSQKNLNRSANSVCEQVKSDPVKFILLLKKSKRVFIDYFIRTYAQLGVNYKSQKRIATDLGICVKTVQRYLDALASYGLISSFYRHRKTCYYNVSQLFFVPSVKLALLKLLPSLSLVTFSLFNLTCLGKKPKRLPTGIIYQNVAPSYNEDYYNKKYPIKRVEMVAPDAIKKIKSLNLTMLGKKELAKLNFPTASLVYADKMVQVYRKRKYEHLFKLFVMIAAQHARVDVDLGAFPPENVLLINDTINSSTNGKEQRTGAPAWQPKGLYERTTEDMSNLNAAKQKSEQYMQDKTEQEKKRLREKAAEFMKMIK